MPHFLEPLVEARHPVGLQIERTGQWLVRRLESAFDSASRKRGLLGQDSLAEGAGLVIAPCQGVHTFGMRFPLDIVGIARDGRVVKVKERVAPRRIVLAWTAFALLELPEGTIERVALRPGDRVIARASEEWSDRDASSEPNREGLPATVALGAERSRNAG